MSQSHEPQAPAHLACERGRTDPDLEYVTQYVGGTLFGGWYRVLHDGRLELRALGSVWYQQRRMLLPQRQARALLAKLVRLRSTR